MCAHCSVNACVRFLVDYGQRHSHPMNMILHLAGVPMVVLSLAKLLTGQALAAIMLFVGGYFLQYLGHRAQGNEVGEVILLKHLWNKWKAKGTS